MRRKRRVLLAVSVVVLAAVVVVLRWQWNNVQALGYLLSMERDGLEQKLEENEERLQGALDLAGVERLEVPEGRLEQVSSGSVTAEALARQMIEEKEAAAAFKPQTPESPGMPESPAPSAGPEGSPSPPPGKEPAARSAAEIDRELSVQVAAMYVLKSAFVSQLESYVGSAKESYLALPAGERTAEAKKNIVYGYFDSLSALEKQCDTEVAAVVERVRALLAEGGRDLSLADQIQETYEQEKSLKKAYYINELNS